MSHSDSAFTYGFRIVGNCTNDRRLITWPSAFVAYSQCAPVATPEVEAYLSAFTYGEDFQEHLKSRRTTKGFTGPTWSQWLWFDIDREGDLAAATADARRLAAGLADRYSLGGEEFLIFFSGAKGYHVGLPTSLWNPAPAIDFHAGCRCLAEMIATVCHVAIDSGVYDRVRAFRAPNSRHPRTGLYKRFLTLDELMSLRPDRILGMASQPEPFDLPKMPACHSKAVEDWATAMGTAGQNAAIAKQKGLRGDAPNSLNRATLEFIRDGAAKGDRHRLLFSAAANLAEFGCTPELAFALLANAGLDSGLPPAEVRRQIECGLKHSTENYHPAGLSMKPPEPSGTEAGN